MDITEHADDVQTIRVAKAEIAKWKAVQEAAEEKVKAALGDAESGEIDGHTVVKYQTYASSSFDVKKMRAEVPAVIWGPYVRATTPRRFTVAD